MKREILKQGLNRRGLDILLLLITGLACAWINIAAATEVYTWTDEDGVTHFSDTPLDGAETHKVKVRGDGLHGTSDASPLSEDSAVSPDGSGDEEPEETLHSVAQERREQLAQNRKESREKQAETDQLCKSHRERLARVEPVRRVYVTNEEGETIRMDDDQRLAMVDESKEFIAKNCE